MKFKKLLLSLASVVTLAACGSVTSTTSSSDAAESDTINIGGNFALTGSASAYGSYINDGATLAFNEINAAGGINGKQINYVSTDNKSNVQEAANEATRLLEDENLSVLLSSDIAASTEASIQPAQNAKVPMIIPSATVDDLTLDSSGNVFDYIFQIAFQISNQTKALGAFADNKGWTTAAVLQDNSSDYGQNLATQFEEDFSGEVVAKESFISGDTDFNSILSNIKAQDPDVLFIAGYYPEGGAIVKQAREMGIDAAILGPNGLGNDEFVKLAGAENVTDFYYATIFVTGEYGTDAANEFAERYEAEFGKEADLFSAGGYDAAMIAADAIERAGSTDPEAIRDALETTTDFAGVTGNISFDEDHNPVMDSFVVGYQDGEISSVEPVSAE
ncbi:ABC transporter substrate-binding protein [Aerococcus sp. 1KP-2016]|uniref:ABC transporter substrate-binding protein n=1 Tax=Aerococcus sp. 1KP-2016 TaxID=1981982 RepID=UPI000B98FFBB|nr:ABC transporter substrate-binding protein [Aerococcus sp. 1KP-2016]OYQ67281.1 branched-chain amino acid ABC transporter substrate-binding protein [Aerococcus sp. 1KP-2016]